MGYLFLFLAIFCGAVKGHCGKKTSGIVTSLPNVSLTQSIRMILCVVIGFFFVIIFNGFNGFCLDWYTSLICLASGLSTAFFVVTWTLCVRKNAYAMISVFLVVSTLIPTIICHFVWDEAVGVFKIIGFCILLFAVIFMCVYNRKVKGKITVRDIVLLILCALFNGALLFVGKWRSFTCKDTLSAYTLNFYTYVFSFVILVATYFITKYLLRKSATKLLENKDRAEIESDPTSEEYRIIKEYDEPFKIKSVIVYVIILSIALFLNNLFINLAADYLPSALLYPLNNGVGLVISLLMGHFLYNEKINRYSLIGICLAIVSFVFMVL